jgi:glycosyltransferase involved in cell wall biosynthesis
MKLCFLAAGNSIHSYRWVKYFAEKGHDVTWISFAPLSFELPTGIKYFEIEFSASPLKAVQTVLKVKAILRAEQPDLLHVHYIGSYGFVALLAGFTPLIATAWGSDIIFGKRSRIKRPFIRKVLQRASLITCDAFHMREEICGLGMPADKVKIINFGIDSQKFYPRVRSRVIRDAYGLGDAPVVISLRNFEPVYDIQTLIKAIPGVLSRYPMVKFMIVGRGSQEAELKSLVSAMGISGNVRFVGFIPNHELPDYLSSMDIYVSTSLSDGGIAASTAEAMACGLPAVITDSGENARWITNGENGFLVPIAKPDILAEKIIELVENAELRERFSKAGCALIQDRNDYYREMEKMDAIYQRVARNRGD